MLRAVAQIGFFTGLGIAIVFFATLSLGRLSVVSVRDTKLAAGARAKPTEPAEEKPAEQKPAEQKAPRTGVRFPVLRGRPAAEKEEPAPERVHFAQRWLVRPFRNSQ